jgi:hypothetical protein
MNTLIDQTTLDVLTEIYKNGVKTWKRDEFFILDCAYYEGRIKRACEILNCSPTFSYLKEIPEDVSVGFHYGYHSWEK